MGGKRLQVEGMQKVPELLVSRVVTKGNRVKEGEEEK